jgi:glyoxylase-like metal-dependent hydrolase (beta-lactamase superfamily II)
VHNIVLAGYAQYAWLQGAEEISASPNAPQKYAAVNDMRRVWDLDRDRFQISGRTFLQFPFLAANAYNFTPFDQRLDGDIAYDAVPLAIFGGGKGPVRVGESAGAGGPDGPRMRRMWMLNNPVVLVRALMDPATSLSAPRVEGKYSVLDATLKQGYRVSVGFFQAGQYCQDFCKDLPAFVRWTEPNQNLGQMAYTTWLSGYASIDGLLLPLAYDTRLEWRDIDWYKVFVDHYAINGSIADLAAPAEVRNARIPPADAPRPVQAEKVADHIWRLAPTGTTAVEFQDHITLFELGGAGTAPSQAQAVIDFARTLVPGKPVTQLVLSHEHFDHITGLRQAVAEGLTIIGRRGSGEQYQEMIDHPAPDFPDDLARNPKPFHFIPVDEKLVLKDPTMELWVLWARNNIHMADAIVAYAPRQKVIMEGDVATASYVWQFWPDNLRDIIDYYGLDVKIDSPVHSVDPEHPGALTMEQVDALLKGGTDRARQMCGEMAAKNVYVTGCPVWSKRY